MVVPEETLIIAITQEDVLINGVSVAKVAQVLSNSDEIIPELKEELVFLAGNSHQFIANAVGENEGHKVTIMGDENISYDLIRKILTTCQQANYTKIAFAAVQKNRTGA
jgi:biopolymer transport protein ExbD